MSAQPSLDKHAAFVVPPNPPVPPGGVTLFERIGGRPGLSRLIKWFYARVRYDPELEAIFKAGVDHWPSHIETLINFWSRMTGGPSDYSGNLAGSHRPLTLGPDHFAAWLRWWERNCREVLAPAEAEEMIALGHRLAEQMQRPSR